MALATRGEYVFTSVPHYAVTVFGALVGLCLFTQTIYRMLKKYAAEVSPYCVLHCFRYWPIFQTSLHSNAWQQNWNKVKVEGEGSAWHCYGVSLAMGSHSVTCHPTLVSTSRLNPSKTGRYSIYLPRRDGRLSWPRWSFNIPPHRKSVDTLPCDVWSSIFSF